MAISRKILETFIELGFTYSGYPESFGYVYRFKNHSNGDVIVFIEDTDYKYYKCAVAYGSVKLNNAIHAFMVDQGWTTKDRNEVRPLVKVSLHEDDKHYVVGYKCPNCNKLYMSDLDNFCNECGQKLREVEL